MIRARANHPSSLEVALASCAAVTTMSSSWLSRMINVVKMSRACVPMKSRKIGTRTRMLSLMPRRLRTMRISPTMNSVRNFQPTMCRREKTEELVHSGGDGDRDRQDVVDDESAARYHPELRAQQLRGDEVAAASRREELDDLAVGERDDEDREGGQHRQPDGQVGMVAESLERLFGAVGRGGEPVCSEAHPGEKRGERNVVEDPRIHRIAGFPDDDVLDCGGQRLAPRGAGPDYHERRPGNQFALPGRAAPRVIFCTRVGPIV